MKLDLSRTAGRAKLCLFGIVMMAGAPCALWAADSIVLQNVTVTNSQSVVEQANVTITAGNSYVVESGGQAFFRAGTKIVLSSGFQAKAGSIFRASITPATGSSLIVNGGSPGSSFLVPGASLTITAGSPPAGQAFKNWIITAGAGAFGDQNNQVTSFTIGAIDTVVQATYAVNPTGDSDGDGIPNGVEEALGTDPNAPNSVIGDANVQLKVHTPR